MRVCGTDHHTGCGLFVPVLIANRTQGREHNRRNFCQEENSYPWGAMAKWFRVPGSFPVVLVEISPAGPRGGGGGSTDPVVQLWDRKSRDGSADLWRKWIFGSRGSARVLVGDAGEG